MSRTYSVAEPHPSIPSTGGCIGGGRGGAGNYKRYNSSELTTGPNATGPASRVTLSKPARRTVPAGRGGAGNMFSESEESIFQFDEEMIARRERQAPIYHIGRGGAANYVNQTKSSSRKDSVSSNSSQMSEESAVSAVRRSTERAISGLLGRRSS